MAELTTGIKVYFAPWQIDLYLVKMLIRPYNGRKGVEALGPID